jgi:uncharacterized protein (TIGR03437 family)
MCLRNTGPAVALLLAIGSFALPAGAQSAPRPDWHRIGNAALDLSLASTATGPIERVWFSEDGSRLYARAAADRTYVTQDFESWSLVPPAEATPIAPRDIGIERGPEPGARVRSQNGSVDRLYAIGRFVYRSDDGGARWVNLTAYRRSSILGDGMFDLAVSPRNSDELAVAAATGIWRSIDGGQSWTGLNDGFPNLPVWRLLGTPLDGRGVRLAVRVGNELSAFEWQPGEKAAWRPTQDSGLARDTELQIELSATLKTQITAVAVAGDILYAGSADGRVWASRDRGRTWNQGPDQFAAPVRAIFADPRQPQLALAVLGPRFADAPASAPAPHVIRTTNAGGFWDDLTANLPDVGANGITADRPSGAVYAATDRGLYMAFQDLTGAGSPAQWSAIQSPQPNARAEDVRLDPAGNQLYVAVDGYGVFATPAPHRFRAPKAASAADLTERPAAPGALVTVFGANVKSAKAGSLDSPVLASSDTKSEIQIPFEAIGSALSLALESAAGPLVLGMPLQSAAPAIFVDAEGAPMVLDADSGVLLDAMHPARSNSRIQILATGLGRVRPQWPSGMAAPLDNPPVVEAPVKVYLDREPVEVTRATLAPGYIGFYLIEITVPKLVNYGPSELYLDVSGQMSNRVRVYIEP